MSLTRENYSRSNNADLYELQSNNKGEFDMEIIENKNELVDDTKTLMVNARGSDAESQDISLL